MIKGMSSRWLALMALAAAVSSVSSFLNVGGVFREAQVSSRRGAGALMARLPPEFRNSKVSDPAEPSDIAHSLSMLCQSFSIARQSCMSYRTYLLCLYMAPL